MTYFLGTINLGYGEMNVVYSLEKWYRVKTWCSFFASIYFSNVLLLLWEVKIYECCFFFFLSFLNIAYWCQKIIKSLFNGLVIFRRRRVVFQGLLATKYYVMLEIQARTWCQTMGEHRWMMMTLKTLLQLYNKI